MDTTASADGTRIAYDRVGHGPTVVVVGGAFADRRTASSLASLLAPRFTVLTYDRRGRGDSGDTEPYAPEREVEDLASVIATAPGHACVYGHSAGAVIALRAAATRLPIRRLAVYEPPFVTEPDQPRVAAGAAAELRAALDHGDPAAAVERFLVTYVGLTPEHAATIRADDPEFPRMVAIARTLPYEAALNGDQRIPSELVRRITTPTLVLDGAASPAATRLGMQALAAALPVAQHVSVDGQDHGVAPEAVAPILQSFFTAAG
jgi:pimeloyl-ACP methyl ester carboxylesterase